MPWPNAPSTVVHKAWCKWKSVKPFKPDEPAVIKQTTTVINKLGLHARASAKLTKMAGSFPCEVWVSRGDRRVNAKSIMGVMMLAAGLGSEIVIETDGAQEGEAMEALLALLANKFGEGE